MAGGSYTASMTYYQFNFTNTGYPIPTGSWITIYFPYTVELREDIPSLTNHWHISTDAITSLSGHHLVIEGAFDGELNADLDIGIQVNDILNPYKLGDTETFKIVIDTAAHRHLFHTEGDLIAHITQISGFAFFEVIPTSTITGELNDYTFRIQMDTGGMNTSHRVCIIVPPELQWCHNSIVPLNSITVNNVVKVAPDRIYLSLSSGILPSEWMNFTMECQNPYTNKPNTNFSIEGVDADDNVFYEGTAELATMTEYNTFKSFGVTLDNEYAGVENIYTFDMEANIYQPTGTTSINQIKITASPGMAIDSGGCEISDPLGISGSVSCTNTNLIMEINGINKLEETFSFKIKKVKNPELSTEPLYFTLSTLDSDGYIGENGTSTSIYMPCNYPCKTCTMGDPTTCESCHSTHKFYVDGEECVIACPPHTNADQPGHCMDCISTCDTCTVISTSCTKCYPDTFLYNDQCGSCPASGYFENKNDWRCEVVFHTTGTEIKVKSPFKIEVDTTYEFAINPRGCPPANSLILIILPPSLSMNSACVSSKGVCTTISTSNISISGVFADYIGTGIAKFNVTPITNPIAAYDFSEINIEVMIINNPENTINQMGYLPLNEDSINKYPNHALSYITIEGNNTLTAAKTTYKFNFTNANYDILAGTQLVIQLPPTIQLVDSPPVITNIQNIGSSTNIYVGSTTVRITGGFPSGLAKDSIIYLEIENLLNPYELGQTETFAIYTIVSLDDRNRLTFAKWNGYKQNIDERSTFQSTTLSLVSTKTSAQNDYTFTLELGYGGLNTSHMIVIEPPEDIQECTANTITAISPSDFLANPTDDSSYSSTSFMFDIITDLARETTFSFSMTCKNPFTTEPSGDFTLYAYNSLNTFYKGIVSLPDMDELNTFLEFVITLDHNYPRVKNEFELYVKTTGSHTSKINEIVITVHSSMVIEECTLSGQSGVEGTLLCSYSGQVITISGITAIDSIFYFNLTNIRNPPLKTDPIEFNMCLQHAAGPYYGDNGTSATEYLQCNYPCKTCYTNSPNECESCHDLGSEVFTYMNSDKYMHYLNGNNCWESCQSHTFNDTSTTCTDCHDNCKECEGLPANCTQCDPNVNLFLHNNECIYPCPAGFVEVDLERICVSILYIYL